ncbi:MAG: hypothetical protein ABI861_06770 [Panacibacter sp.]
MNDTFNLKRFGWLFKKTLMERPMQLIGLSGLSLAIVLLSYAIGKITGGFDVGQNASFMIGLVGGGCFLASLVYAYFFSNASGSSFLTLPASHFEKWLCGILITGVLYVSIFLLFYRVVDMAFVTVYHNGLDPKGPFYKELYEAVQIFPLDGFVAKNCFIMFLNFAGGMFVGSLYFNKAGFIKVALIICSIFFGSFLVDFLIANIFLENVQNTVPYYLAWIKVGNETGRLELPANILKAVNISILYIIPFILWTLAYVRLREKEF